MEREAVLVGIDAGTTKVTTLIGEVGRSGDVNVIGYGIAPSIGMKKGMVANIDQTVNSIASSVEKAERLSGYKISSAFVAVGGSHISSQNSRGVVAVSGHKREVSREDVARATDAAKAVQVPSNREMLHVVPRGSRSRRTSSPAPRLRFRTCRSASPPPVSRSTRWSSARWPPRRPP